MQVREWQATREKHGTDGAVRAARGRNETVDPETGLHANGQFGDTVEYFDGKRNRTRPVRAGEMPTHLYIPPAALTEKQSEAVHTIYAAGIDSVNPESIEDCERFFKAVQAEREELYAGLQEKLWLERNGESGLVHVHVASNATIYRDFTLNGVEYKAGQKMAGDLTKVNEVRGRGDQFLDEHPELGFSQRLARVGSQEYSDAQKRDGQKSYWEKQRGKESNQDRARREIYAALVSGSVSDRDTFIAELAAHDVKVVETGLRRGKPGKNHDYSYLVGDAKQGIRGTTLGVEYSYNAVGAQLDLKALGQEIEMPAGKQHVGEAKPLPFEERPLSDAEQAEYDEMVGDVQELARQEREAQGITVEQVQVQQPVTQQQPEPEAAPKLSVEEQIAAVKGDYSRFDMDMSWMDEHRPKRNAPAAAEVEEPAAVETAPVETLKAHQPDPKIAADALMAAAWDEHPEEMGELEAGIIAELRAVDPEIDQKVAEIKADTRLRTRAFNGELSADIKAARESLQERAEQARQVREQQQAATPEQDASAQQSNGTAEAESKTEARANDAEAPTPQAKRRERQLKPGLDRDGRGKGVELIAVVIERQDGGAHVDYQLAAADPAAKDQVGLHLYAEEQTRRNANGSERTITRRDRQLKRAEYEQLKLAAGDNSVENGKYKIYGLRGNLQRSLKDNGYTVPPNSYQGSTLPKVQPDVLHQQRVAENSAREDSAAAHEALKARVKQSAAEMREVNQQNRDRSMSHDSGMGM